MVTITFDYFRFRGKLELNSKYTFLCGDIDIFGTDSEEPLERHIDCVLKSDV